MSVHEEFELLHQFESDLEPIAEETEELSDGEIGRREFMFFSLAAAAASTFGFGAKTLLAQAPGAANQQPQQPPPPQLGNGEPLSWTFQPYPGGTGALMEKLINERGAAAFKRAAFTVQPWQGPVPTSPEEIAFLPAHRLSALIKEKKITSLQLTKIYL